MATQYTAGLTSGQVLTAATMNSIGAEGENYTPVVKQSNTVTATVIRGRYQQIGKLVHVYFKISVTGTGTAGQAVNVSLPITSATTDIACGSGGIYDASTTTMYAGWYYLLSTTTVALAGDWATNSLWGGVPNIAIANGDVFYATLTYEAA